ncbi:hypothetical protein HG537_0C03980 [Torulaspora globosa]|uniref:Uncharacterized protein n=1 Tax=Torulaspora globosa TaxID=48254 RepID=A0A7H9HR15_9SACH|nr:hypothetical protein HG537_0C03980 [Torulaspora sp. CBS 2947]
MIPKTHIVSIPIDFPDLYKEQVNKDGFMWESARARFFMFDTLSAERSLDPISADELKLKAVGDKVKTVWKDINDDAGIGSDTDQTASSEGSNRSSRMGSAAKEPDLVELFKELDINVDIERSSVRFEERSESVGSKCKDEGFKLKEYLQYSNHKDGRISAETIPSIEKRTSSSISPIMEEDEDELEVDNSSSDKGKENEVFSPVNSGNRSTALTDNNDCSSSISPLPLDSSPKAFKDFNVHQSKREAVKEKFKEYVGRSIQKCFTRNSDSLDFDTMDSFAEFEGAPWDEMTTKKIHKVQIQKV